MKKHEQCNHLECNQCDFKTILRIAMNHHKRKHQQEDKLQCSFCDFQNTQKKSLNRHLSNVHRDRVFKCEECEFRTIDNAQMRKHQGRTHLKCGYCNYKTTLQITLDIHEKKLHQSSDIEEKFQCDKCGRFYLYKRNLVKHRKLCKLNCK
jgi:KRAB domain-containing zinc finger protein